MNIYCFLRENYYDQHRVEPFLGKGAIPIVCNFDFEKNFEDKHLSSQVVVCIKEENFKKFSPPPINLEFVLEYSYRRFPIEAAFNDIVPRVTVLYNIMLPLLKKGDIVITCGSASWQSRTLYELALKVGAHIVFLETYIFKEHDIFSSIPFERSCYGDPELLILMESISPTSYGYGRLNEYLESPVTKYDQPSENAEDPIDIFIPGQVYGDANVVLINSPFSNTEELCYSIARSFPDRRVVYKKHPRQIFYDKAEFESGIELLKRLSNVSFVEKDIHSLLKCSGEIHTLSSSVGLEAELLGRSPIWHSTCVNSELGLVNDYRRALFFECCRRMVCPIEDKERFFEEKFFK